MIKNFEPHGTDEPARSGRGVRHAKLRQLQLVGERLMLDAAPTELANGLLIEGAELVAAVEVIAARAECMTGIASCEVRHSDLAAPLEKRAGAATTGLDAVTTLIATARRYAGLARLRGRSRRCRRLEGSR